MFSPEPLEAHGDEVRLDTQGRSASPSSYVSSVNSMSERVIQASLGAERERNKFCSAILEFRNLQQVRIDVLEECGFVFFFSNTKPSKGV